MGVRSNMIPIWPSCNDEIGEGELTAFRGLLIAATASALFWGLCLTAVWLMRARN
jgi:hypothetical protein